MNERTRRQCKELLIRAKVYRALALIFSLAGVGILLSSYYSNSGGGFFFLLIDPFFLALIALPFVPAFIFILVAQHKEKKILKLMEEARNAMDVSRSALFSTDLRNEEGRK